MGEFGSPGISFPLSGKPVPDEKEEGVPGIGFTAFSAAHPKPFATVFPTDARCPGTLATPCAICFAAYIVPNPPDNPTFCPVTFSIIEGPQIIANANSTRRIAFIMP